MTIRHTSCTKLHHLTLSLFLVVTTLTLSATTSFAAAEQTATSKTQELFRATYQGKLGGFTVTTTRTLTAQNNHHYVLTSQAKNLFAKIEESSEFSKEEGNFFPHNYRYQRKIFGKSSSEKIVFNWQTLTADYIRHDKPEKNKHHSIQPGTLDPSLYQLKLQQDLFNQVAQLDYTFVKTWKVKDMSFAKIGRGTFTLKNKQYTTINLQRIHQPDKKHTFISLIPELAFQIAEIHHIEDDGKSYTLTLKDFRANKQLLNDFYRAR